MNRRLAPSVNAGSMADIAFLLLIFFLVTTTIQSDAGISRKLPPPNLPSEGVVKKKNLFEIVLNQENKILVEGELMKLEKLKEATIAFLDNGSGTGKERCEYCKGDRDLNSSDNPQRAIILFKNSRESDYAAYIAVQNELLRSYQVLRNREAVRLYGKTYTQMQSDLKDVYFGGDKIALKESIRRIQNMYPQKISESQSLD